MPTKRQLIGEVVQEYLENFPNTKSLTLARMIYKDNSMLFKDVEAARNIVRYYRGAKGDIARKTISTKEHFRVTETHNPFDLPEPRTDRQVLPYRFPKELNNTLIISDIHLPYHDLEPINVAYEYAVKHNVDSIIFNGDTFDFYALSRYQKDPRIRNLSAEIQIGKEFLQETNKIFPKEKVRKFFKLGNHEERWEAYLMNKAPELVGSEIFEIENVYEFEEFGFERVDGRQEIHVGDNFTVLHGHEFTYGAYSPVNPARGFFTRYGENVIGGHLHRPSHHTERTGRNKIKSSWSLGCNCLLRPEYATLNKWTHGFAHLTRESENEFHLQNYMVIEGKLYNS